MLTFHILNVYVDNTQPRHSSLPLRLLIFWCRIANIYIVVLSSLYLLCASVFGCSYT